MQFTKPFKQRISRGEITRTVRHWKRPQARAGGRYNIPPFGAVEVIDVSARPARRITAEDAWLSGFTSRKALLDQIGNPAADASLTIVDFRYMGAAAVNVPSRTAVNDDAVAGLVRRVQRMDERSARGPWAAAALRLINDLPGTRAAELAGSLGWETQPFKANVRRLKALGLTESLETGYRLSDRGRQVLEAL